jgi:hypothetical protein
MSEITWSKEMGFMKTGSDVKNMIHIGELSMKYLGLVIIFCPSSPLVISILTSHKDWPDSVGRKAPQYEPLSS